MTPTAEEMEMNFSDTYDSYASMMIAFARHHVKAALEAANERVNYAIEEFGAVMPGIVLNSYSLSNIR